MSTSQPPVRPAERYGDLKPTWYRKAARAAVIALAVVGVALVAWIGIDQGNKSVQATVVTWHTISDSQITTNLDVTMKPGHTGQCVLEAKSNLQATVGYATLNIPASSQRTQRVSATITTQQRGASVVIDSCTGT